MFSSFLSFFSTMASLLVLVMTVLCNGAGHYIFTLWFLLSIYLFSSSNLAVAVYHTSTRDVALVRI